MIASVQHHCERLLFDTLSNSFLLLQCGMAQEHSMRYTIIMLAPLFFWMVQSLRLQYDGDSNKI